jgi:hypothetical protein
MKKYYTTIIQILKNNIVTEEYFERNVLTLSEIENLKKSLIKSKNADNVIICYTENPNIFKKNDL